MCARFGVIRQITRGSTDGKVIMNKLRQTTSEDLYHGAMQMSETNSLS